MFSQPHALMEPLSAPKHLPPSLAVLRHQAEEASRRQAHSEALALWEQAEPLDPHDLSLQIDLATAEYLADSPGRSVRRCERILHARPDLDECVHLLALSWDKLHNTVQAAALLRELVHGARAGRFADRAPDMAAMARCRLQELEALLQPCAQAPLDGVLREHTGDALASRWTAVGGHKYDLSHLDQPGHQRVAGPVQDDEALLLYALVRVMRIRRVLEVGGLSGYSARNFLRAMDGDEQVALYTVDLERVPAVSPWHYTVQRDCSQLEAADVHHKPLDLIFFDAHVAAAQLGLLARLESQGLLHPNTVIALHDTGLHPQGDASQPQVPDADGRPGFVHQSAEREMVNRLRARGWDAVSLHMPLDRSDARLPARHGLTLMKRFSPLA